MLKLWINRTELEFQPTPDGYQVSDVPLGTWRRALDGTLHCRVQAVKKRWNIEGHFGGQRGLILSLPGAGDFYMVDVDGVERRVMCTAAIPSNLLGAYILTLEEV